MPAGWIHSVTTKEDSIVIGGNFICLETMNMHVKVFKMEKKLKISETYRFPYFLTFCEWVSLHLEKEILNPECHILELKDQSIFQLQIENARILVDFLLNENKDSNSTIARSVDSTIKKENNELSKKVKVKKSNVAGNIVLDSRGKTAYYDDNANLLLSKENISSALKFLAEYILKPHTKNE
ncbi:JmjC domain-containing histone demethylation protein 1 [Smittium culicis]|uniref:[histone H3]-dimethyl-L-lysine(36) demethylase n=1 Tax=Smittium culicis TaxID=133412 RepID=A0A1R1X655_9FUNG|nr:JmjC domain-containing histone demethylation protein 1 [Smittium culicis]